MGETLVGRYGRRVGLRTPMLLTAPCIPPNNEQMPDLILNKRALI